MAEWHQYWYRHCKGCGRCRYAETSNTFISDFFRGSVCPGCGDYPGDWISTETTRTIFLGVWWNPLTWHRFEVQSKDQANEDPKSPHFDRWIRSYHG